MLPINDIALESIDLFLPGCPGLKQPPSTPDSVVYRCFQVC